MIKLNLGCGSTDYREGWVNIDKSLEVRVDEYRDLAKDGLKSWSDDSVEEIHSGCMLEQLEPDEFKFLVNECYRVLKVGGKLGGYVPSTDPRVLHLDPMDKMFFQVDSFKYLDKNEVHWQRFGVNYGFKGWSSHTASVNTEGIIFFELIK